MGSHCNLDNLFNNKGKVFADETCKVYKFQTNQLSVLLLETNVHAAIF